VSAASAAFRRGGAASAALVAAVALVAVVAAVGAGSRIASSRTLPALNRSGDSSNYARNAIGHLAPVDAKFVARRVGSVGRTRPTTPPASDAPARPRTETAAPPVDPSIHGTPGAIPGLAPGGWDLTLKMTAESPTARSGDDIHYVMTITNIGGQDFYGRAFLLEWHTPAGTFGRNSIEQCNVVPVALVRALCSLERLQLSPGLGETSHERFDSSGLIAIQAGKQWVHDWYVTVLPSNAAGSTIFNHAHLNVNISGQQLWIRTPDVVVTVVE
jgi:hypothetical protein